MLKGAETRLPDSDARAKSANAFSDRLDKKLRMLPPNAESEDLMFEAAQGMMAGLVEPNLRERLMSDTMFSYYIGSVARPIQTGPGSSDKWLEDAQDRTRARFDGFADRVAGYGKGPYDSFESLGDLSEVLSAHDADRVNRMRAAEDTSLFLRGRLESLELMDKDYVKCNVHENAAAFQDESFGTAIDAMMHGTVNEDVRDAYLARADFREYAANLSRIQAVEPDKRSFDDAAFMERFLNATTPHPEFGREGPVENERLDLHAIVASATGRQATMPLLDYGAPGPEAENGKGFRWEDYGDGSGEMVTNKGLTLFSYDEATREYVDPRYSGWRPMSSDWKETAESVYESYVKPREDVYQAGIKRGVYYPFFEGQDFRIDYDKAPYIALTQKAALPRKDFQEIMTQMYTAERVGHADHSIHVNEAARMVSGAYLAARKNGTPNPTISYEGAEIRIPMDKFVKTSSVLSGQYTGNQGPAAPAAPVRESPSGTRSIPRVGLPDVGHSGENPNKQLDTSLIV